VRSSSSRGPAAASSCPKSQRCRAQPIKLFTQPRDVPPEVLWSEVEFGERTVMVWREKKDVLKEFPD